MLLVLHNQVVLQSYYHFQSFHSCDRWGWTVLAKSATVLWEGPFSLCLQRYIPNKKSVVVALEKVMSVQYWFFAISSVCLNISLR